MFEQIFLISFVSGGLVKSHLAANEESPEWKNTSAIQTILMNSTTLEESSTTQVAQEEQFLSKYSSVIALGSMAMLVLVLIYVCYAIYKKYLLVNDEVFVDHYGRSRLSVDMGKPQNQRQLNRF